ncbi:hypothetical protein [Rickettsia oklahomensis]|uniref:Uncharacterized protein n=1 Tax=Rickettsia oklahomensis TaxID=3141789 RepID=A0AAU7C0D9_9RICK
MSKKKDPKHDEIVSGVFDNLIVAKEFFEMRLLHHIHNINYFPLKLLKWRSFVDIKFHIGHFIFN